MENRPPTLRKLCPMEIVRRPSQCRKQVFLEAALRVREGCLLEGIHRGWNRSSPRSNNPASREPDCESTSRSHVDSQPQARSCRDWLYRRSPKDRTTCRHCGFGGSHWGTLRRIAGASVPRPASLLREPQSEQSFQPAWFGPPIRSVLAFPQTPAPGATNRRLHRPASWRRVTLFTKPRPSRRASTKR